MSPVPGRWVPKHRFLKLENAPFARTCRCATEVPGEGKPTPRCESGERHMDLISAASSEK